MKITFRLKWLLVFTVLAVFSLAAFGQVDTNTVPGNPPPATPGGSLADLLLMLIPVIVPIMIALGKWALPKVPSWILPILAPALGALLDYINSLLTGHTFSAIAGAALGAAGVGVRELVDQAKGRIANGPATPPTVAGLLLITFLFTGCAGNPVSHSFVRLGVSTGVSLSAIKHPEAVPFIRIAGTVICSQAGGTNLSPTEVMAAINASPLANGAKTPQGTLILNGALGIYTAVWDSYGTGVVNKYPELRLYLQDTCNGINDAVPKLP